MKRAKEMKKVVRKRNRLTAGLIVIFMLVMSMSSLVNAETTTESITESGAKIQIQNTPSKTAVTLDGKTFDLYRVFDVTVVRSTDDSDNSVTDSMKYSVNAEFQDFFDGVLTFESAEYSDGDPIFGSDEYNDAAMDYVNGFKTDTADNMQTLVTALREYVLDGENSVTKVATTSAAVTETTDSSGNMVQTVSSEALTNGYYLIVDSEATTDKTGLVPAGALVNVPARSTEGTDIGLLSANAVVTMKGSMPTINKEVWHDNITNANSDKSPLVGTTGSWDIVADYEIGDTVEYRITATIPSDLSGYQDGYPSLDPDAYTYIITDTLSDGITFNKDSLAIYTSADLSGTPVAGYYHKTTYPEGTTFQLEFDMVGIKNDPSLQTIEIFYIYYTGTVTENAVVADSYENNVVTLEYGNDPYDATSTDTAKDEVQTYTFDLEILKTEGDGNTPLAGATFALYRIASEGATPVQVYLEENTSITAQPTYYVSTGNAYDTETGNYAGCITTDATGVFHIQGLDDATEYLLKEVKAPDGFNAADPIYFAITANYTLNTTTNVSEPTISATGGLTASSSGVSGKIINTSSALLPTTGGMGTTIFMIIGGTMMFAAFVLLIVRRRKER